MQALPCSTIRCFFKSKFWDTQRVVRRRMVRCLHSLPVFFFKFSRNFTSRKFYPLGDQLAACFHMDKTFFFKTMSLKKIISLFSTIIIIIGPIFTVYLRYTISLARTFSLSVRRYLITINNIKLSIEISNTDQSGINNIKVGISKQN